jgi:DNA-directed RNA polymerase specialized sigma24 family protein
MLAVVRHALPKNLRRRLDSDDFMQTAWAAAFAHRDRLAKASEARELRAIMLAITRHKVIDEVRHQHCQKLDIGREVLLDDPRAAGAEVLSDPDLSPEGLAMIRERLEYLLPGSASAGGSL